MSKDIDGPRWLLAELTYKCPLQCPYCSNPTDYTKYSSELTTSEWINTMQQARDLGAVQLGFSGGEPLVRADLEQLVEAAREMGFYTNLITSGVGMDAERVSRLKQAGLDHIQISFQASDEVLNDRFAGTKAFQHKKEMAREVKAQGYPMVLNFVLYRDNIDRVEEIMDLALELEADQVELANTQYYGWALHNRTVLLPTKEQVVRARMSAEKYQEKYTDQCRFIYVIPDYYEARPKACMSGWGKIFLNIAPDGSALPCQGARQMTHIDFPNVRDVSVEDIWFGSDAFNVYRGESWMRDPCKTCDHRHEDFGGCRCQAYQLTGDARNADPVCSLSPDHEKITQAVTMAENQQVDTSVKVAFRNPKNSKLFTRAKAEQ